MLKRATFLLLALGALAGCSSSTGYELQTLRELLDFYGGTGVIKSGINLFTDSKLPQGRYLEITITSPQLLQHYADLTLPASKCAYQAYHSLASAEPGRYAYYKINLADSATTTTHTFTYLAADLAQAERATDNLTTLVAAWQQHELLAAINTFNPTALTNTPADSLLPLMARLADQLAPISSYDVQGWRLRQETAAGKPVRLVQLVVAVPHPKPQADAAFAVFINPALRNTEKFLYGARLLE